jgi:hypothetical protein
VAIIDKFAPEWQFREMHRIGVLAPADAALRAVREVTAREIRLFRFLTWLRRLGRPGLKNILNPPPDQAILDVALHSGFLELASSPREIVIGTCVVMPRNTPAPATPDEFHTIAAPGYAKAVMNFRIEQAALAMCVVTTETRVWATDEPTRKRFALYWWSIRLGSGLIRRMWLRAIRRRAETIGS